MGRQQKELKHKAQPATIEENLMNCWGQEEEGSEGFSFSTKDIPRAFIWALNMCVYLFAFCF